ncbi:MAG TPA: hypothetical protein VJ227_03875 [Patescibacteria group bacterium]|nr:hypothetical protein [Patescibacteria group bacterium]
MRKLREFLKNNSWIWIVVVVAIAFFGDIYLQRATRRGAAPTPTPVSRIASYKNVTPGVATEADLRQAFGTPVKTTVSDGQTIDEFTSTSELRLHSAIIENGKVIFIKEIVSAHDTRIAKDITDIYGPASYFLYNKSPNDVFNLYAYPSNGIAYVGSENGILLEVWYFQPTTFEDFLNRWASEEYTLTEPSERPQ